MVLEANADAGTVRGASPTYLSCGCDRRLLVPKDVVILALVKVVNPWSANVRCECCSRRCSVSAIKLCTSKA